MAASQPAVRDVITASLRARIALAVFCLALVGLLGAQVLLHGPMVDVDQAVSLYFSEHRDATLTRVLYAVTMAHESLNVLAVTALIAAWFLWRRDFASARALLVVPFGVLLNVVLKHGVARARPAWDDPVVQLATYSFPSGHAVAGTVFYGMLCALVFTHVRSRTWRAVAAAMTVAMVALVVFSRVYLGAHYPSDVIAGIAVGTLCLLAFFRLLPR